MIYIQRLFAEAIRGLFKNSDNLATLFLNETSEFRKTPNIIRLFELRRQQIYD